MYDDVVNDQKQSMVVFRKTHYMEPQQWTAREIERLLRFSGEQLSASGFCVVQRQMREINNRQRLTGGLMNLLHRNTLPDGEGSAQHLVTAHNFIEAITQDSGIQRAANAEGNRNIVEIACRFKLMQEPEPLLGEREWQIMRTSSGANWVKSHHLPAAEQFLDGPRLVRNGGSFKNAAQRQSDTHNSPHAGDNLQGE